MGCMLTAILLQCRLSFSHFVVNMTLPLPPHCRRPAACRSASTTLCLSVCLCLSVWLSLAIAGLALKLTAVDIIDANIHWVMVKFTLKWNFFDEFCS